MNLIEQLGGYDRASRIANCKSGVVHPTKPMLAALLEYRREHNIFEKNDSVVKKSGKHWSQVFKVHNSNEKITTIQAHVLVMFETRFLRHATDAEIKAGRRL